MCVCETHIIHIRKNRSSPTICVGVHIFGPNATIYMVQHPKKTLGKKSLGWGGEGEEFNLKYAGIMRMAMCVAHIIHMRKTRLSPALCGFIRLAREVLNGIMSWLHTHVLVCRPCA